MIIIKTANGDRFINESEAQSVNTRGLSPCAYKSKKKFLEALKDYNPGTRGDCPPVRKFDEL